jgi:hypothetical protein
MFSLIFTYCEISSEDGRTSKFFADRADRGALLRPGDAVVRRAVVVVLRPHLEVPVPLDSRAIISR